MGFFRRALMGTWIEIAVDGAAGKVGTRRALMGTWIEIVAGTDRWILSMVVPSWARGLKYRIRSAADMSE